ncbi:MAG: amidohydrolase family protein, partial [Planctomycetes bacterium]|nr:amidohydrolase family protein [Planctomycetota bacterium]
ETGKKLNRFRVIHAEMVMPEDFARFVEMDLIAEVNPSQMEDDMRWVIDRLGPEREGLVYPFKTFLEHGIMMTVGSDIPGAAGATFSNHPALAINAMVHRTGQDGTPKGGWIADEKISVHEVLKAYTINGAYGTFDEDVRGSIKAGKLADIAVCSVNIINHPEDVLDMEVEMTIMNGKIVFEK